MLKNLIGNTFTLIELDNKLMNELANIEMEMSLVSIFEDERSISEFLHAGGYAYGDFNILWEAQDVNEDINNNFDKQVKVIAIEKI